MNLAIKPGSIRKLVHVPASKSYANRALILAALKPDDVLLQNMPEATDVTHLIAALKQLGLSLVAEGNDLRVSGSFPACESEDMTLSAGEGGTTARFLAALLLKGKRKYQLKLGSRLKERPWQEFLDVAAQLGALVELRSDTLFIQGPIYGSNPISIDCRRTTQFLTAFQLAFGDEREIKSSHLSSSQSYVSMTEEMIRSFKNTSTYSVPLDWSSASYPLVFAALNEGAKFPGLGFDPLQSDAKLYEILKEQKVLQETSAGLKVLPLIQDFSLRLDVSDCLDLVPALAFFLSHIKGSHALEGIANLVHKESDRVSECLKLLSLFGREASGKDGVLMIEGHREKVLQPVDVSLPEDHRMIMTAALFLRYHSGGTLSPAEAVEKSYPNFFELFA